MENKSGGNVLFIILIAVILFAAISYAVSRNSGGGKNVTEEMASTKASELLEYGADLEAAYQRLRVVNGCDFKKAADPNPLFGNPENYPSPCNLFDKNKGGGVPYNVYKPTDPVFGTYPSTLEGKSMFFMNMMFVKDLGTTDNEVMFIMFNIDANICKAINKVNNIAMPGGEPPLEETPYEGGWGSGYYYSAGLIIGDNGSSTSLVGQPVGCYRAPRAGQMGYHFYYVLEAF